MTIHREVGEMTRPSLCLCAHRATWKLAELSVLATE